MARRDLRAVTRSRPRGAAAHRRRDRRLTALIASRADHAERPWFYGRSTCRIGGMPPSAVIGIIVSLRSSVMLRGMPLRNATSFV
jgi:hypothetical protein